MLDFFANNWSNILVGGIVLLIVILIATKIIVDKKNHKSSCASGCANCPSRGACHK